VSGTRTSTGSEFPSSGRAIGRHPNASVAVGSGSGLGALVVWGVGLGGVVMPAEVGAVIGGGVAGIALLVGKQGIKGVAAILWRGNREPAEAAG
jgi:hypothetical protein